MAALVVDHHRDGGRDRDDVRGLRCGGMRSQAPPGVKLTRRAFGRDRRYPIVNGYRGRV